MTAARAKERKRRERAVGKAQAAMDEARRRHEKKERHRSRARGIAPWAAPSVFLGASATIVSVVINRAAMDAASCSADLTTLVGSMIPFANRLPYSPVWASKPKAYSLFSRILRRPGG